MIVSLAGIRVPISQICCVKEKTATIAPVSDEFGDERNLKKCILHPSHDA